MTSDQSRSGRFRQRAVSSDVVVGVLGLALAVIVRLYSSEFPRQTVAEGLGPAFFPFLLQGSIATLSLGILLSGLFREDSHPEMRVDPAVVRRVLAFWGMAVAYGVTFWALGFFIATFLFLLLTMLMLGTRLPVAVIVALGLTGAIYGVFVLFFRLPLNAFGAWG